MPGRVVVGSGASELILRLIRHFPGAVHQLGPTFSEYARGALLAGRPLYTAASPDEFLDNQRSHPGLGFICWPNNPTGDLWNADFIQTASRAAPVVLDLAYAPLCSQRLMLPTKILSGAYRLHSPGKAYGLTGIRAAYLVSPGDASELAAAAPSWVLGVDGVALLEAGVDPRAESWVRRKLPELHRWRSRLAKSLQELGVPVRQSPASFLLAEVGDATRVTRRLRELGIRVRDATSFGLSRFIRMSAQDAVARRSLIAALKATL
jgi:histidinol-phosphate aminotransferase